MKRQPIDLSNRVAVCAECGAVASQCTCGSTRHPIVMSKMAFTILQALEDANAPIKEIKCVDYVDTEQAKAAGVVR